MAYDAATGDVVMFGGDAQSYGTWTWDGSTWTQQHPATSPPYLQMESMAYDAATRTVVLYGGIASAHGTGADVTWTWNGTTWRKHVPATSPPNRDQASMAYDPATRTVVLFGGIEGGAGAWLNDTWTWDGTAWTQQVPAASPKARLWASMAYDAATRTVVLFGGDHHAVGDPFNDTWTWHGTTWVRQRPATKPSARSFASIAYDKATKTVVLYGGQCSHPYQACGDTWTWGSN